MKKILSILSDPYLHIIGIGLVILALTTIFGESEKKSLAVDMQPCSICKGIHEGAFSCARIVDAGHSVETVRN